jgi:NodT family efflux transporter outer membrane factor (OMF) lipoprotein
MIARKLTALLWLATAAGCSLAPPYARPGLPSAGAWKTIDGWRPANPNDGAPRSDWWTAFGDPVLDHFVAQAIAYNQTIVHAAATYRQARAATHEARASLFPVVGASGGVTHSQSGSGSSETSGTAGTGSRSSTNFQVGVDASWTPDFFGAVTNQVRNARYTEQSRLADLANARLAVEGELATDYLSLRASDAQSASLTATVEGYRRSLQIATNRYNAGVVARTDVFQAQSQLASAQSDLEDQRRARAEFEDAIAVLVGENPAAFRIAPLERTWIPVVPAIPLSVPSALLERRPDIASAERLVAAANASIGIQRAAFFPTVSLSGQGGLNSNSLSGLFSSAATVWSLGASVVQTLLDFGARRARVDEARAAYDATVASYRQTALAAFQEVQDNLAAQEILARQEALLKVASGAADRSETTIRNQYRAGLIDYTEVVAAQATAQSARRALLQAQLDRQNISVALVQALGGGWSEADLADGTEAARADNVRTGNVAP